ncbi:MAG: hypothetical protein DVB26_02155 [Verrucomicrobia bacterium]|nr:MAG: hypothetical protein DVB26_02155 [Verrucomicrobiota bacterium]
MTTPSLIWLIGLFAAALSSAAPLQVAALHPLMADLARQVGGERVTVVNLVGEGGNPHRFEPRPGDLKQMQASALVLAAGKGLEPYLNRLKDTLHEVSVIEVGRSIPSLMIAKDGEAATEGSSAAGTPDPHWWHGVDNMRRAARVVALALADKDPAGRGIYLGNAQAYGARLELLQRWAHGELAKVPRGQRKLVTAHQAFAYFAREFDFTLIAVAGLNDEQNNTPQALAMTLAAVRLSGVKAIFPESNTNAKVLQSIATATATTLATPLIADGNGSGKDAGFEGMLRHNVQAITQALAAP